MPLIRPNVSPSLRELRIFVFAILPGVLGIIGLLVWRHSGSLGYAAVPWGAAIGLAAASLLFPPLKRVLFLGWIYATYPIAAAVSLILLGGVFFLVLTPLGLAVRLFRRDVLERTFDRTARSYWKPYPWSDDTDRYFRQF